MYEIPIKIQNYSVSSKYVSVKSPEKGIFRIQFEDNVKARGNQRQVAPGMFFKILIIFECHEIGDYEDSIEIGSENGFKMQYKLQALMSKEVVLFEPFLNFGFCSINSTRTEYVDFYNEGSKEVTLELRPDKNLHPDMSFTPDRFTLGKKINDKEYEELLYMKNKDDKDRSRLKAMTLERQKNKFRVMFKFE